MRRWLTRRFLGILMTAPGLACAHAETLNLQFHNQTSSSFDYTLQVANEGGKGKPRNTVFLGTPLTRDLTDEPIIFARGRSHKRFYRLDDAGGNDLVAFNLRMPDGSEWGLRKLKPGGQHVCRIGEPQQGAWIHVVLHPEARDSSRLELVVRSTHGARCSFRVVRGYGPSLLLRPPAHPDMPSVHVEFRNDTSLRFDYSLQLANSIGEDMEYQPGQFVSFGKPSLVELTNQPIMPAHGHSVDKSYAIASYLEHDHVAFNMVTVDGQEWGLRGIVGGSFQHGCRLSQDWNGKWIMFLLEQHGAGKLVLVERLPNDDECVFTVTPGFGPSL